MSSDTLSSARHAPCPDDTTVRISNVSYRPQDATPDPSTSPDDDPFDLPLNTLDIKLLPHLPSSDIESDPAPCHDPSPSTLRALNPLAVPPPSSPKTTDDAFRAQFDTGAFASCTDQRHLLHNFVEFSESNPCPIRLLPATTGSDTTPSGYGYLHVPCATQPGGFLPVRTFYHPQLRTTVIDERDLITAAGYNRDEYASESLFKYPDAGTCTYYCSHKLRRSQDIALHGILRHGKAYTMPLIPPVLPCTHPDATQLNSIDLALATDPEFRSACERATIQNIYAYQEHEYTELREQLRSLPVCHHSLPWHHLMQESTPVNTIRTATERLLWHQRLGHPSDYYLFNAHRYVKGVPQFKHHNAVLEQCPTCIQSKQRKEPPGPHTIKSAL